MIGLFLYWSTAANTVFNIFYASLCAHHAHKKKNQMLIFSQGEKQYYRIQLLYQK